MPSAPLQYTRRKQAPRLAPRHMPELARQVKAAGAAGVCTECALRAANTPGGGEKKK